MSDNNGANERFAQKDRGTSDDIEVMMLILKDNPLLRRKVLEKIKQAKTRKEIRDKNMKP